MSLTATWFAGSDLFVGGSRWRQGNSGAYFIASSVELNITNSHNVWIRIRSITLSCWLLTHAPSWNIDRSEWVWISCSSHRQTHLLKSSRFERYNLARDYLTANATVAGGTRSPVTGTVFTTTSTLISSGLGNTNQNINHGIAQDGNVAVWIVQVARWPIEENNNGLRSKWM